MWSWLAAGRAIAAIVVGPVVAVIVGGFWGAILGVLLVVSGMWLLALALGTLRGR